MNEKKLQVGGTLNPRKHLFIERKDIEELLYSCLKASEYCNILASRQVGKSSLMKQIGRRLVSDDIRVVDIDIAGELGTPDSADDWYRGFLGKLVRSLRLDLDLEVWWTQSSNETPNQRLMRFFAEEIFRQGSTPLVIFVDEIDSTLKLSYTDDFFTAIRTMYNERGSIEIYEKVCFCLIGVATANELIKDRRTTPFNVGTVISLRDFDQNKDDLTPLSTLLSTDLALGKDLLQAILRWTNGHPFLTSKLCAEVHQAGLKDTNAVDTLVRGAFESLDKVQDDDHFKQMTRFLGERVVDQVTTLGLYKRILSGRAVPDAAELSHTHLKLAGLVKRDEAGNLVVRNSIYRRIFDNAWIARTQPRRVQRQIMIVSVFSAVLGLSGIGWDVYDKYVLEPPRLAALKWEKRLLTVNDPALALQLLNQLNGKENHPTLGRPLSGFEAQAQNAYDEFWKRWDEQRARELIASLTAASDEHEALKLFQTLIGQQPEERQQRVLTGYDQRAQNAYNTFWERWDEQRVRELIASLTATSDENEALRLFQTLIGQQPEERQKRVLEGYKQRALTAYRTFWQSRSDKILKLSQERLMEYKSLSSEIIKNNSKRNAKFDPQNEVAYLKYDEALVYGLAAAAKTNSKPTQNILALYLAHSYDVLKLTFRGFRVEVTDVSYSPDGQRIVSIGLNSKVGKIWDANTGEEQVDLKGQRGFLNVASFSADGLQIVTGDRNDQVRIWDAISGKETRASIGVWGTPASVEFSSDGRFVAVGSSDSDNTIRVLEIESGKEIFKSNQKQIPFLVRFSPDNSKLIASTVYGTFCWDIASGKRIWKWKDSTISADFTNNGSKVVLASAGQFKTLSILDGKETGSISGQAAVVMIKLIDQDKQLVSASIYNSVRIWNRSTGDLLHNLDLSYLPDEGISEAHMPSDKQRVVTGQRDGTARVWDIDKLRNRKENPFENITPQELWDEIQKKLGLTLDENDRVVPLYPGGPRSLKGWTDELEKQLTDVSKE